MTDFWRRWHISLIEWINDYIFKPINFYLRNLKKYAIVIALTSTFLIAGIWHKVSLGFIIWGLIQSTILIIEFLFKNKSKSKNIILVVFYKRISTYLMFAFSLIFGGAVANYNDSIIVLKKISSFDSGLMFDLRLLIICIVSILVILLKDSFEMRKTLFTIKNKYFSKSIKWSIYYIIILSILFFGVFKNQNFIYFQY
jgi:D-alanyl-lipoteichoic acid acyltransferase DltB (MBOAT superfamily)